MTIHEILRQQIGSEMALVESTNAVRSKLTDALVKSPNCSGGLDDHEYEVLMDDTTIREDGDLFRLRAYLRSGCYVAVGVESQIGNRTLIFPLGSRHAVATERSIPEFVNGGFPVDKKAEIEDIERFEKNVVDVLDRAIRGEQVGNGFVEGKWIPH